MTQPECGRNAAFGSAQDWGGGVRLVGRDAECAICGTSAASVWAVIDRVLVCEGCTLRRVATVARMALARRRAGLPLSLVDRRCISEMEAHQ